MGIPWPKRRFGPSGTAGSAHEDCSPRWVGPEQAALCHKLSNQVDITGVVVSRNVPKRPPRRRARLRVNRILGRVVGRPFLEAWWQLQREYARLYPDLPPVPRIRVENVNDPETLNFLRDRKPDAVLVSGTNLVGRAIVDWAFSRRGILNLHTGLSPYVKGGPNCTNWCFAEATFHLIGSTVMWLDTGIDSGPILTTARPKLSGSESLSEVHWNVMEHAHCLCVQAVSTSHRADTSLACHKTTSPRDALTTLLSGTLAPC